MRLTLKCILAALACGTTWNVQVVSAQGLPKPVASMAPAGRDAPRHIAYQARADRPPSETPFQEEPSTSQEEPSANEAGKKTPTPAADDAYVGLPAGPGGLPPCPPVPPMTDSCNVYFGRGSCCPPQWYVDQGIRLINRSRPHLVRMGSHFVVDPFFALIPAIDSRSTTFGAAAGYTLTVGYHLGHDAEDRDDFFEFTYWGLNHWNDSYAITGNRLNYAGLSFGNLFSPFAATSGVFDTPVAGFNRADEMATQYDSEIHNFEWNIRFVPRCHPDRLVLHPDGRWEREAPRGFTCNYLAGLRYITFDETFAFRSRGRMDFNGVPLGLTSGEYLAFARNDMVGLQIGADVLCQQARWAAGVRVKAGPYMNWTAASTHAQTTGATFDLLSDREDLDVSTGATRDKVAFVGEVVLFANYKLRKNVTLHASYDFYWLSGLALAPEQMTFAVNPPPNRVATTSTLLFQGISLRAELLW